MAKSTATIIDKLVNQSGKIFFLWSIQMFFLVIIGLSDLILYETFIKMLKGSIFTIVGYFMFIGLLLKHK